jgi:hypothetical protein
MTANLIIKFLGVIAVLCVLTAAGLALASRSVPDFLGTTISVSIGGMAGALVPKQKEIDAPVAPVAGGAQ